MRMVVVFDVSLVIAPDPACSVGWMCGCPCFKIVGNMLPGHKQMWPESNVLPSQRVDVDNYQDVHSTALVNSWLLGFHLGCNSLPVLFTFRIFAAYEANFCVRMLQRRFDAGDY